MHSSPLTAMPSPYAPLTGSAFDWDRYDQRHGMDDTDQLVADGTRGHGETSSKETYMESKNPAIAQTICDDRRGRGIAVLFVHSKRQELSIHFGKTNNVGTAHRGWSTVCHPARDSCMRVDEHGQIQMDCSS